MFSQPISLSLGEVIIPSSLDGFYFPISRSLLQTCRTMSLQWSAGAPKKVAGLAPTRFHLVVIYIALREDPLSRSILPSVGPEILLILQTRLDIPRITDSDLWEIMKLVILLGTIVKVRGTPAVAERLYPDDFQKRRWVLEVFAPRFGVTLTSRGSPAEILDCID